jgi:radical SAM superfamily enzyme YgiQ (UPF0313 family)
MANVILYSQLGYRPLIWRTISCYVLARWIEEHGYTCQVIEFTHLYSPDELVEATKMFVDKDTLLIGASSTMWSTWSSDVMMNIHTRDVPENIFTALTELRGAFPHVKTVVGGHRGFSNKDTVGLKVFDYISEVSYGEDWLLNLLDELSSKSMATKLRRNKFNISSHRFVYKEHDCILPNETLPIEWGRGCIFKCPFCRSPNLGKRPGTDEKNIDLMVDEFTEMYEKFGTTSYYFIDETFNADAERIENLAKVYHKLPFKLEFLSYNRPDLLDKNPHTQDILHECGQRGTLMGIETFNPTVAKLIKKPWSSSRGKDFLLELQEKWPNTHIDCSFIAGLPGMTKEEYYETADWLMESKIGFYNFKPLVITRDAASTRSEWEINSEEHNITWPDPQRPLHWVWGENNGTSAFQLAAELNRYMGVHKRWFMWALGATTATGVNLSDIVNRPMLETLKLTGDLYDQETKLFQQYKDKLKTFAGR